MTTRGDRVAKSSTASGTLCERTQRWRSRCQGQWAVEAEGGQGTSHVAIECEIDKRPRWRRGGHMSAICGR